MKKTILSIITTILLVISITGCSTDFRQQSIDNSSNLYNSYDSYNSSSSYNSSDLYNYESIFETWQEAYGSFLRNILVVENADAYFSLRDLDNNGTPEIVILRYTNEITSEGFISIYTYKNTVYKIGEYADPKTGVAGLRISNNPRFPGLFNMYWGGGIEHYGYLTIVENKLLHENLWVHDRTGDSPLIKEISDNKELIKESMDAFPPYEYTENLLDLNPINEDNITHIIEEQN